jgi:O-antigen/teichoic acid export membrane protein
VDKYKRLISNTVIFAIGTFSSKVLVFLLMPLYTRVLDNAEYGVTDLIVQAGNLLLPLVSLGIVNGVIRFGLDKSVRKSDVFTTGFLAIVCGFVVMLFFWPLLDKVQYFSGRTSLIYLFVLMSSFRSLCSQFVRARGLVRLYAFDGILSTATTILFNIWFLVGLRWGVTGYVLAIVCSDTMSVIFLLMTGRLWRFVRFAGLNLSTALSMLKYSIPMIPNTMFWWITNVSDRYLVTYFMGSEYNGLYAVAYKIPSIVMLVSGIFMDAWQMSAVTETKARGRFFTKVFQSYGALVFIVGSGIILTCKVLMKLLASEEFYAAWQYVPLLVVATVFSCFVNFLGTVYMVEKRSVLSLATTAAGAVLNIVLNVVLIPHYGVNGAAFATFFSYFLVFLLRAWNTRRFIPIRYGPLKLAVNSLVLLVQCFVTIYSGPNWVLYSILLTALILLINGREVINALNKLLGGWKRRRRA